MPVHDVAARGFDAGADAYERARPSYPPAAVDWIVEHCGIEPGRTVCDLAAGTGKLTRLLAPNGASLIAVEPVEGMSRHLRGALPDVPVAAGTAEALPFADESLDAATVAQAFHWFDADRAFAELRRVLRPGGRLALLWNARDRNVAWVDAVWSIMDRVEKKAPWREHDNWHESALGDRNGFGELHETQFENAQALDHAAVIERFASVSHVAVLPDAERAAVLDEVREVLDTHPDTVGHEELSIPYRVDAFWLERL